MLSLTGSRLNPYQRTAVYMGAMTAGFQAMAEASRKAAKGLRGMRCALRRVMRSMNPRKARGLRIHTRRLKAAKRRG